MNVNLYVIKEYENETAFRLEQNKPNQTRSEAERLSCVFLFEEGLQDFCGGDGVESLSFFAPGKVGSG